MEANERKKVSVIGKYALNEFSEADWYTLGQITGKLEIITRGRLLHAFRFGDDDYAICVAEVLDEIFSQDENSIYEVINHFDIDVNFRTFLMVLCSGSQGFQ